MKLESSKNIHWSEGRLSKKEFSLNGFSKKGIGGIRTLKPIEFGEFLKLSFFVFLRQGISDGAAILDLDLDHVGNSKDFVSVLSSGDRISIIHTNGTTKTVTSVPKIKNEWINFDIFLKRDSVAINIQDHTSTYFEFDKPVDVTYISFGNNQEEDGFDKENAVSFLIKDIVAETEYFKLV
jgi:hypothetical protein